ncbi:putative holin [Algiphilus sp.]|uniref:putative holin n=1 Tax=Algiphilus sp. TaxID=1872431 RepID=UPI0025C01FDF|nr:putative holin [Algiphilus sp.]MCK5769482.1 putative holin [Algiphilus sp.]
MRNKAFRLWPLVLISIGLLATVAVVAPGNLPVVIYKLALVSVAGCAGYWLDRWLFPSARVHTFLRAGHDDPETAERKVRLAQAAMLRRAIVVAAAMVGVTMGL